MTRDLDLFRDNIKLPMRYNSHNNLIFKAELDLRVGMYVIAYSNALRTGRDDIRADFGHSLWAGNLDDPNLQNEEYFIPIVERYNPSSGLHKSAPRVIELSTNELITHSHCGSEPSVIRKALEKITQKELDRKIKDGWLWINKIF